MRVKHITIVPSAEEETKRVLPESRGTPMEVSVARTIARMFSSVTLLGAVTEFAIVVFGSLLITAAAAVPSELWTLFRMQL
jgi:hypothetical protein